MDLMLKIPGYFSGLPAYIELPSSMARNIEALTHELSEIHIGWLLHTTMHDDSGSEWDGKGEIPVELNPGLVFGWCKHMVQHIMVSLHTISGYGGKILSPEEYAVLVPWRKKGAVE